MSPGRHRVYPRVCGGTDEERHAQDSGEGLSPRVRGNRVHPLIELRLVRSIPACAGEPRRRRRSRYRNQVYPRVCGGTAVYQVESNGEPGLSPRVRGNRRPCQTRSYCFRSIPACAGEPRTPHRMTGGIQVYPRVCGGTAENLDEETLDKGLSPRVRGNRVGVCIVFVFIRSIPACAGEPSNDKPTKIIQQVYPRVCGGTHFCSGCSPAREGLSPRVRGNQILVIVDCYVTRSIPACAGEPQSAA